MVAALNALLECLVTGFFTALFIGVLAYYGILPIVFVLPKEEEEEEDE